MDIDDLSQEAYYILCLARLASDPLCPQLGALANKCRNEDEWLGKTISICHKLYKQPANYLDRLGFDTTENNSENFMECLQEMIISAEALQKIELNQRTFG